MFSKRDYKNNVMQVIPYFGEPLAILYTVISLNWDFWMGKKDFYGISYRDSCYKCRFARPERVSDITIGDFWGIKNPGTLPFGTEDGLSVALPVTEKGLALLDAIRDSLFIEERPVEEAVAGNDQLRHPFRFTRRVSLFRAFYGILPFDAAARLAFMDKQLMRWLSGMKHKILRKDAK